MSDRHDPNQLPDDLLPTEETDVDIVYEADRWQPGEEIDPDSVRPAPGVDEDGNAVDPERLEDILKGE